MPDSPFQNWTLFLDRDGVINHRLPGRYVQNPDEFDFMPGVPEAIAQLNRLFSPVVVVTNQQGIGKGLMTETDLAGVHAYMLSEIAAAGGKIDGVYFCPELAVGNPDCRKPNTGMAREAQKDFPNIRFDQAVMVGDSWSDMEFGNRLGMYTVFLSTKEGEEAILKEKNIAVNAIYPGLKVFADVLLQTK
ncbi:MAG: HAD family hydrolase [Bacteroidetes bacterium]|nr:HAD family hydrolase [Bacteroidota bacterium]